MSALNLPYDMISFPLYVITCNASRFAYFVPPRVGFLAYMYMHVSLCACLCHQA